MGKRLKNILSFLLSVCLIGNGLFIGNVFGDEEPPALKKAKKPWTINVGKEEKFQFHSIQEALDSVSEEPTQYAPLTIVINEGVYEEEVHVKLPYVSFIAPEGKSAKNIVITYDKANGHVDDPAKAAGTQLSATVTLEKTAVGFSAEGITFQNSYNIGEEHAHRPQAQAVALVSLTDKVVFNNCRFIGRQDTLYLKGASKGKTVFGEANNARTYLKNCYIEGTVDYIFGDGTAFFENCDLHMTYRDNGGHYTAANTTLSNIGYVFYKCRLTADYQYNELAEKTVDLGRPWQGDETYPYYGSHTVFIECVMPTNALKTVGFVPWNDNTVKNKIRYMEYGTIDENENPVDISSIRNDFVKILTPEQAKVYTAANILRGDDGWNPSGAELSENINAVDITLDKYSVSIPKNSSGSVKALVLPLNAGNKNIVWTSENENIATVDENGGIFAVSEGKTTVSAKTAENNFSVYTDVYVTAEKTSVPSIKEISLTPENPLVGDIISVNYSYNLKSDEDIDNALIKWTAADEEGNEFVIEEGRGMAFKSYAVDEADFGCKIRAYVYPETVTSYGEYGAAVYAQTQDFIGSDNENEKKAYLRDNFSDINKFWTSDGNLIIYKNDKEQKPWDDVLYNIRLRFDPKKEGISSEDSIDFYTAYSGKDKSYYRLNLKRGSNTNSLKAYFYKKPERGEEVLLASDEESMSNKIPQAKGEQNPYFSVKETFEKGKINVYLTLEGENDPLMSLNVNDDSPLSGFMAFESTSDALLKTSVYVRKYVKPKENNDIIKICLAGDSTVKTYGSDNSIGGWGEYLQHYFDSDHVKIINKAEGGRSTRSYINQGRLDDAVKQIGKGDYLFIQFGHNDARTDENAYLEHSVPLGVPDENGIYPTYPGVKSKTPSGIKDFYKDMPYSDEFYSYESGGTFKWFLKQYVDEARKAGATPILITPVSRVFFDENGKITPHVGEDDGYVKAVRQLAQEMDVALVDMFDITKTMYENYGVRVTQGLHNIKEDGTMDISHYNKFGSNIVTSKLIEALRNAGVYACIYSKNSDRYVSRTEDLKPSMVYIVGGTTAADGDDNGYVIKKAGWGDYINRYLADQVTVMNMSVDGKSSKSYTLENNYKNVFANIGEGDYILIQFGADDIDKDNSENYTDPYGSKETEGSFRYYLYNYYIKPALDKKAIPLVISPCPQSAFKDKKAINVYSEYIKAISELCTESGAYYINLNDIMTEEYTKNGEPKADLYHALFKNKSYGKSGRDIIALSKYGAEENAKTILKQAGFSSATLKDYVETEQLNADEFVEKGEFVTDILKLIDGDSVEYTGDNFSDISNGKQYTEDVGKAKKLGIIKGDLNNRFYPEEDLKNSELIEIVESVLELKNARANFDFRTFSNVTEDKISREIEIYVLGKLNDALLAS